MEFYTYIYYDRSKNNEPFYVGKGFGERAWTHLTESQQRKTPFYNRLKSLKKKNIDPVIGIINCKDEEESLSYEIWFIYKFGRKDQGKGPLLNLTDGGEGISNPSLETREKISLSNSKRIVSDETRLKMSKSHLGKTQTEESNRKRSEKLKGKNISNERKTKLSETRMGKNNPMFGKSSPMKGKSHSEETKDKIKQARSRQIISDETRKKMSESAKRRHQKRKGEIE